MTDTITLDAPKTSTAAITEFVPAYRFLEFVSLASHVGKPALAGFTAQLLGQFGSRSGSSASNPERPPPDSRAASSTSMRSISRRRLAGAEAAVLRPGRSRPGSASSTRLACHCGPIYAIDQMFEDAQVKHLGIAQDVPNDEAATSVWSASPSHYRARQANGGAPTGVRRADR